MQIFGQFPHEAVFAHAAKVRVERAEIIRRGRRRVAQRDRSGAQSSHVWRKEGPQQTRVPAGRLDQNGGAVIRPQPVGMLRTNLQLVLREDAQNGLMVDVRHELREPCVQHVDELLRPLFREVRFAQRERQTAV